MTFTTFTRRYAKAIGIATTLTGIAFAASGIGMTAGGGTYTANYNEATMKVNAARVGMFNFDKSATFDSIVNYFGATTDAKINSDSALEVNRDFAKTESGTATITNFSEYISWVSSNTKLIKLEIIKVSEADNNNMELKEFLTQLTVNASAMHSVTIAGLVLLPLGVILGITGTILYSRTKYYV
ncbi:MAG: hypothetical protein ACRC4M_03655 [Mycoplasma sp.]